MPCLASSAADSDLGATEEAKVVPPTGLEPVHPAPEAGALSTELRGPRQSRTLDLGSHRDSVPPSLTVRM
jgi:hypothetical protein